MRRRPDIREAERNVAAATAEIGVAMGSLFPIVSFTGIIGYQSNLAKNLVSPNSGFYSFGPGYTWDLIDFGRVRAMVETNIALRDENFYQYKSTVLNALGDVENSLVNYAEEAQHYKWLKSALDVSKKAADVSMLRYRAADSFLLLSRSKPNSLTSKLTFFGSE